MTTDRKSSLKQVLGILSLLLIVTGARAQNIVDSLDGRINAINTAVPFLRITPDARSGAMGDVGVALSPDANSMHHNISKLAFAESDFGVSATYTPWLRSLQIDDIYLAYLSGFKKIDEVSSIGMSIRYFSLGSITFTNDRGDHTGNYTPNEFEFMAGYARKLSENFSVGVGLKYIYSNLAAGQMVNGVNIRPGMTAAGDVSAYYENDKLKWGEKNVKLALGTSISNVGAKITYTNSVDKDFIPMNLGMGSGLTIALDDYNEITFAFDMNKLLVPTPDTVDLDADGIFDYKAQSPAEGFLSSFADAPGGAGEELKELMFSTGIEYWYDQQFAVRAGYFNEHSMKGNRKYFTVGLGIKYNVFGLNFSYLVPTSNQRNPLDNTLRFSLLFDFAAIGTPQEG